MINTYIYSFTGYNIKVLNYDTRIKIIPIDETIVPTKFLYNSLYGTKAKDLLYQPQDKILVELETDGKNNIDDKTEFDTIFNNYDNKKQIVKIISDKPIQLY